MRSTLDTVHRFSLWILQVTAELLLRVAPAPALRPLVEQLPKGRILELSGTSCQPSARTTTTVAIARHAQTEGETVAWIQPAGGPLFPPDLSESGLDFTGLVVIHVPTAAGPHGLTKAAELLLRSGAWGLVVVDLGQGAPPGPPEAWQGRLLGLCRQHDSCLVLLTDKPAQSASLGALVGLRVEPRRRRLPAGRFAVEHQMLKNKTGAPTATADAVYRGPWGLG
jgi:recombination protein RecA